MPADHRVAFRRLGLPSLVSVGQGFPQALRSAASGFTAAAAGLSLAVPLLGLPALASSPAAWAAYDAQVRAACRAASTLVGVVARGERLDLPDPGLSVLLLEGRYPQPHMQGQRGLELCVFEQVSGRASVVGADRLAVPVAHPPAAPRPSGGSQGMTPARP